MPSGFNPLMALGSGVLSSINSAATDKRAQQDKLDDEYRKTALQVDYQRQVMAIKKQTDDDAASQQFAKFNSIAGLNKAQTTNQAQFDALKAAQTQPAITTQGGVTGQDTPPPTNTPQTSTTVTMQPMSADATEMGPGTSATPPLPAPNADNGENPSPEDTTGDRDTPVTTPQQTPQQGDATNPLKSPMAQNDQDASNVDGGQSIPMSPNDMIKDQFGNQMTRAQANRAVAYGMAESAKTKGALPAEAAYWIGLGKVQDEDGQLGNGVKNTGVNNYGFNIGTVPDGFVSPVVPEAFNETSRMPAQQAAIKIRNDDVQLAKDKDAATQANRASTEFSNYLSGNESGDSGGLNKIGFMRDITSSLSSDDATRDSLNKSLTFNIVGFERTPGMRLTQAEFFIAREALPGRGNTPEANKNIAQFWQAKLQLPQEYAQFKQDYIGVNGSWNEAIGNRMFQQYQKDNPIFDPKILADPEHAQMSDFKLNPNRQSLEQYSQNGGWNKLTFLGMKGNPAQSQGQPAASAPTSPTSQGQSQTPVTQWQDYFKPAGK